HFLDRFLAERGDRLDLAGGDPDEPRLAGTALPAASAGEGEARRVPGDFKGFIHRVYLLIHGVYQTCRLGTNRSGADIPGCTCYTNPGGVRASPRWVPQ